MDIKQMEFFVERVRGGVSPRQRNVCIPLSRISVKISGFWSMSSGGLF